MEGKEIKEETERKEEQKKRSKLRSIKNIIAIVAIFLLCFIVIGNKADFIEIADKLVLYLIAYAGVNVWQKKIFKED